MSDRFFASRNVVRPGATDEDRAMGHEHWGPFDTTDEAREELVRQMRDEGETLHGYGMDGNAAEIMLGADKVEAGDDQVITWGVVSWKISPWAW